jgi:hypothetical protein
MMRPVVLALSRPCRAPHAILMNPGLRKALPRALFSRPVGAPIQRFRFQSEDVGNGQSGLPQSMETTGLADGEAGLDGRGIWEA